MRRVINRKKAFEISVLIIALIALMSVWPFRIWTDVTDFSPGGELTEISDYVNYENVLNQRFIVQYKRLSSIDIFISEVELGRYINLAILDENTNEVFKAYVDVKDANLPGFVKVPIELNAEVGKEYYLILQSCRSKYSVGLENVPDDSEYVGSLYYAGAEIPARHINAVYHYRIPMGKAHSLLIMLIIATIAGAIYLAIGIYYNLRPEKNAIQSVEKMIRYVANPIAGIVFAGLMIMVFPLKLFDQRPADIVFYEIGIVISAFIVFYAINHKVIVQQVGVSFWQSLADKNKLIYCLIMLCMAMVLWYACDYMNDLYDIFHTLSERKMIIWLLLLMLLTFTYKEAINIINLIWLIASVVGGIIYYSSHVMADTEKEYDLHNAALKYGIIIAILLGFLLINILRNAFRRITKRNNSKLAFIPTFYGIMLLIFFVLIIVFRNTRWWGATMAVMFTVLYYRVSVFYGRKDWYKILYGGLMVNFILSLGFSLLHRYFPAYVSGRFGFIFHTVTVTAEYLIIMGATAAVALMIKIVEFPVKGGVVNLFKSAWKEMVLFGWAMAYAIFTVSRTAYLSIIVCLLCVIILTLLRHKGQFMRIFCTMLASVLICFPAAFTLQRIIPSIVSDPVFYMIDDADSQVRGGADWDSTNFMCVERFIGLFSSKILGKELGDYHYPVDIYNYDEDGNVLYDNYGWPIEESNEETYYQEGRADQEKELLLASNGFTLAEYHMLLNDMPDYVDAENALDVISNGRITIFRSYIKNLNLTGHDVMGAELPGGEIAVHAHNTYIQVAYDNGLIVGALFILVVLGAIIAGARKYMDKKNKEPLCMLTFALAVGFVVAGTTEWVFHICNPMTLALLFSFAGIVTREVKE